MVRRALNHPFLRHISYLVALSICLYLLVDAMVGVMFGVVSAQPRRSVAGTVPAELYAQPGVAFPDFGFMLSPEEFQGRVFRLSQNYPPVQPELDEDVQAILAIDPRAESEMYLSAVRDYIFAGNTERPGYENDFFLEDNLVHDWYHAPWQHWGPRGREGFHGLYRADPIPAQTLASTRSNQNHTYVVEFYNDLGGYTIGQIWQDPFSPDLSFMADAGPFPAGTVAGRMVFTTLDEHAVPALTNPIEWTAYVYTCDLPGATTVCDARQPATVRLLQLDVMVRDPRSDASGWIFGSLVYDGALGHANRWANLVPVGLTWENPIVAPDAALSPDLSRQLDLGLQNFMEFQKQTALGFYGAENWGKSYGIRHSVGE